MLRVVTVIAFMLSPLLVPAQPNLAGHWTLDAAKSTTNGAPLPIDASYAIALHGDTLIVDRHTNSHSGVLDNHFIMLPTGVPVANTLAVLAAQGDGAPEREEMSATITARWAHDTLVSTINADMHDNALVLTARWSLSADGMTLTEERDGTMNGTSNGSQVLVFRKK